MDCYHGKNTPAFPAYQIHIVPWQWGAVAAQSNVIVSHLTNLVKAALYTGNFPAMPFVVWTIGVYSIVDLFLLRPQKFWGTTNVAAAFAVFKIVGFMLSTCAIVDIYLGVHFGFIGWFFDPVSSLGGNDCVLNRAKFFLRRERRPLTVFLGVEIFNLTLEFPPRLVAVIDCREQLHLIHDFIYGGLHILGEIAVLFLARYGFQLRGQSRHQ